MITLQRFFNYLTIAVFLTGTVGAVAQPSLDFATGKALFDKNWVPAPSSTTASDGLGPYYNARSCRQCHPDGGRGDRLDSLVVHIDDPVYGYQLQRYSVSGLAPEGVIEITDTPSSANHNLSVPAIQLKNLHYGPLENPALSARIAPSLRGQGLLEGIPLELITARADAMDSDGDGISGRVNWLTDDAGQRRAGRFGWKAAMASLDDQVAGALSLELGIGNPIETSPYGDCTQFQVQCLERTNGNSPRHDDLEASQTVLDLLLTYVRLLPPPARLYSEPAREARGENLFMQSGCAVCHVPALGADESGIRPYTDLLLHDLGPGLADDLVEGQAAGSEWRTPPLWGLGRLEGGYLHDGRAETLHEAVLWHDGEAAAARESYLKLDFSAQNDLFAFLNSL